MREGKDINGGLRIRHESASVDIHSAAVSTRSCADGASEKSQNKKVPGLGVFPKPAAANPHLRVVDPAIIPFP